LLAGTPDRPPRRPMRCPPDSMMPPLREDPRERIDLRAVGLRGPLTRLEVRRRSPRMPSVVSRPREPRPTDRART
jgi:hypothetical protein